MKRNRTIVKLSLVIVGWLSLAGTSTRAQAQQGGEPPKAPAKTYGPIGVDDQQDENQTQDTLQPDNRPLTGFQEATVGTPMERHSYWVPGVSYYNAIQSSGALQGGGNNWTSTSYVTGSISLLENWSRSRLALNYSGGGDFSTDSTVGNGWFQQLSAIQTFSWTRMQLTLLDQFAYLPQAQFGFGAGTGLANPGIGGSLGGGLTGLAPGFNPGQTIFTVIGPRYTNTGGLQVNYLLTPRTSITLGGLVSILRFSDAGNIESNNYIGNAGFNYQISRNDTVGLQYRYSSLHYLGSPLAIGDHIIQVAYGRKITGRLALQLSAGPEITNFKQAQGPGGKTQVIAGSGSANLTYAFERGAVSANYFHGVTGGSGVFQGANTDQVTGTATRKLNRVWSGDLHMGYARNRNAQTIQGISNATYDTLFAGASASHPLGRNASFTVGYTAYVDDSTSASCAGSACSSSFTVHQISLAVNWHSRPFVLR